MAKCLVLCAVHHFQPLTKDSCWSGHLCIILRVRIRVFGLLAIGVWTFENLRVIHLFGHVFGEVVLDREGLFLNLVRPFLLFRVNLDVAVRLVTNDAVCVQVTGRHYKFAVVEGQLQFGLLLATQTLVLNQFAN